MDATLSESDMQPRRTEQLILSVMRMLLVHLLSQFGIAPRATLSELVAEKGVSTGDSYSCFLDMFKTRGRVPFHTPTREKNRQYDDCLSLSPLGLDPRECSDRHLLSDDQLMQLGAAIERISLPDSGLNNPIDQSTILGNVYELSKAHAWRRERGIFYTPTSIAAVICDLGLSAYQPTWGLTGETIDPESLGQLLALSVSDNACGSGVFLVTMLHRMVRLLQRAANEIPGAGNTLEALGASPDDGSSLARYIVQHNLHGRDIDSTALRIARTQLWLATCMMRPDQAPLPLPDADLAVMDSLLVNTEQTGTFDLVVGNPPYMKASSLPEGMKVLLREKYPFHGEYNSHALFVHSGLRQLRESGVLAYIVHKNILTLDSYSDLRRLLLDSYQCVDLIDCGPGVFKRASAETGIIVLRNARPVGRTSVRLSRYPKSASCPQPTITLLQTDYARLVRPWKDRYLLNINEEDMSVLSLLETLPRLSDSVSISRGIETGHNARFLSPVQKKTGNWLPVLRGKDISAFRGRQRFYLDNNRDGLSKPGPSDLLRRPKLIVQQNSRNPIAFYDDGRFLVLNSATYISEAKPDFLKSVCVFLNSRLVGWFFRKVATNDARLTVNVLPNNLGLIPLPAHFSTGVFQWLCDRLTALYAESEQNTEEIESLRKAADAAVLESYFSQLFPEMYVTRILSSAAKRPVTRQSLLSSRNDMRLRATATRKTLDAPIMKAIENLPE